MRIFLHIFLITLSYILCIQSSKVFNKLFRQTIVPQQTRYYNAHSYQYPVSSYQQTPYTQNSNGYYYQPPPPRRQQRRHETKPQRNEKSYKDICHMIHNDGFTNPGNVPKCPF